MAIYKYLDLSTGHVTEKDMELLQGFCRADDPHGNEETPVHAYTYDKGAFVMLPPTEDINDEEMLRFGFSEAFVKVVRYADRLGTTMFRLDADGDVESSSELDWKEW